MPRKAQGRSKKRDYFVKKGLDESQRKKLSKGDIQKAKQMVIPEGSHLTWSSEENKMVWR